jgi:hypothetical protein
MANQRRIKKKAKKIMAKNNIGIEMAGNIGEKRRKPASVMRRNG